MEETGATEILAGLHIEAVVGIVLALIILRLALLRIRTPSRSGTVSGIYPFARAIAEVVESVLVAGVLVFLIIRPFFIQAFYIPSPSIEPTLCGHDAGVDHRGTLHDDTHDHIFGNKLVYRYSEPKRGDIIVFRAPKEADEQGRLLGRSQKENVLRIQHAYEVEQTTHIDAKRGRVPDDTRLSRLADRAPGPADAIGPQADGRSRA